MKLVSSVVAVAMLGQILPTQAAATDPMKLIYLVPGVRDTGTGQNTGVATVVHCTNHGAVGERLSFLTRQYNGILVDTSGPYDILPFNTFTVATHSVAVFSEDVELSLGSVIDQGSMVVRATSLTIFCSAMIVDAAAFVPQGVALHLVRYNPAPTGREAVSL